VFESGVPNDYVLLFLCYTKTQVYKFPCIVSKLVMSNYMLHYWKAVLVKRLESRAMILNTNVISKIYLMGDFRQVI
jgi:hypothetical protein